MKRLLAILFSLVLAVTTCGAQKLTVESMEMDPFDRTASINERLDFNNNSCGLIKVRLAVAGAKFGGNIIEPVKYDLGEYSVYVTEGTHLMTVRGPGFVPLSLDFRDYGIHHIQAKCTYILTLLLPTGSSVPVDDGMRYLIVNVTPADAIVFVDDKLQKVQDGSASVLLPKGTHSYRVEANGYTPKSETVEIGDSKVTVDVALESALAQLTVNCPTAGAKVYVNGKMMGAAPWSGQLTEGNYQIEAQLDGYRPQQQSLVLREKERRTIDLPALTAVVGAVNVNYKPVNAEVWMDGKKLGTSPDVFRNILVGTHSVEIRKSGYQADKKTVTISEGQTAQLSGSLEALASSGSNAITTSSNATVSSSNATVSSSNAITSSSNATVPVPEAIDLGLSVKWASFNLGASKPEETGNYYKWGETKPADTGGWSTYKYAKGSFDKLTKYCSDASYGYNGFTDGKTKLAPMDDAATVNLGDKWRMPTSDEIQELINRCKREWTSVNGINGIRVTGPNGKSIFFPASGYRGSSSGSLYYVGSSGYYWSGTPNGSSSGCNLYFYSGNFSQGNSNRAYGFPVRPVRVE